mmetsp:Transcript_14254/g.23595  ORF Transcript_14254/g.23595 Transcript_14254/m.23595 type:complete len:248 (+) Transcript_14254:104-847(+)
MFRQKGATLGLLCGILSLDDGSVESVQSLVGDLVFLVELTGLEDGLLDQISDDTKGGSRGTDKVVFVIKFRDLGLGGRQSILDLFKSRWINSSLGFQLGKGVLQRSLSLCKDLVLGIQLSQVVVNLDGRLGDSRDNLGDIVVHLGGIVGSSSSNGSKDWTTNSKTDSTSDKTSGEFNSLFLDGNQGSTGRSRGSSRGGRGSIFVTHSEAKGSSLSGGCRGERSGGTDKEKGKDAREFHGEFVIYTEC